MVAVTHTKERETTHICYLFFDINVVPRTFWRGINVRHK